MANFNPNMHLVFGGRLYNIQDEYEMGTICDTTQVRNGDESLDQTLTNVDNNIDMIKAQLDKSTTVEDGSLTYEKLVTGTLGFVTPQMFGAKADGVTDDYDAIQQALDNWNNIYFPKGDYKISSTLKPRSNTHIVFSPDASLSVYDGSRPSHGLMSLHDVTNVTINCNGADWDAGAHNGMQVAGKSVVNSHIIDLRKCKDITIMNANMHGSLNTKDGIVLYDGVANENIKILGGKIYDTGRNSISIINGKNVLIEGVELSDNFGGAPYCGIDVEKNTYGNANENIVICNCYIHNNNRGMSVVAGKNVIVEGCYFVDNCKEEDKITHVIDLRADISMTAAHNSFRFGIERFNVLAVDADGWVTVDDASKLSRFQMVKCRRAAKYTALESGKQTEKWWFPPIAKYLRGGSVSTDIATNYMTIDSVDYENNKVKLSLYPNIQTNFTDIDCNIITKEEFEAKVSQTNVVSFDESYLVLDVDTKEMFDNVVVRNNIIIDNSETEKEIKNKTNCAICSYPISQNLRVEDNYIEGSIQLQGYNSVVSGNVIKAKLQKGCDMQNAWGAVIENNNISAPNFGIYVPSNSKVSGNILTCGSSGIYFVAGFNYEDVMIERNTITTITPNLYAISGGTGYSLKNVRFDYCDIRNTRTVGKNGYPNTKGCVITDSYGADGTIVNYDPRKVGTTENRPTEGIYQGYVYYDTTLGKPVFSKNGINQWVDATGALV